MASSMQPVQICGFTLIPTKYEEKSHLGHYLYAKAHNVRETDICKPRDRTLFVLNIPPYVTEECLQRLFENCGKVQSVFIHKKPTSSKPIAEEKFFSMANVIEGFKVAYIVFKNATSVEKALNLPFNEAQILSTNEYPLKVGMSKWCSHYQQSKINATLLQKSVNTFMVQYDKKVEEEKQREKEMEGVEDEDGWVTVGKHGKNKGVPRTEAQEKKVTAKERKRRKEKELLNFYSFQQRETKREHIAHLREKFEEDKKKIAAMKANRKFRPY